jgi:hypothetical protein
MRGARFDNTTLDTKYVTEYFFFSFMGCRLDSKYEKYHLNFLLPAKLSDRVPAATNQSVSSAAECLYVE